MGAFYTSVESKGGEGTNQRGRMCLGIYQDVYLLFLTAGVLFEVPFILFKWKIILVPGLSHMIQKVSLHILEQASTLF
jgi:hypothetical protein